MTALHAGPVGALPHRGRIVASAIRKRAVTGPCELTPLGLAGDEQADAVHHGGADKALCVYPQEHYAYWSRRLGRVLPAAAFGENLTVSGLDERRACIGDVYAVGTALVQVTQPRQPCWKLAALHEQPQLALWIQQTGRTGFYLRVVRPGAIERGLALRLTARPHPQLTVAEANRVMHHARHDRAAAERLLVGELSASWRRTLRRRLDGTAREDAGPRLHGP